mmetsp:Transcript_12080/g.42005  ORF Transcript_12080/g.42005 Transcript_12080/m.42005 type:complete len:227 (-) Transcript_12080:383-1063(-)
MYPAQLMFLQAQLHRPEPVVRVQESLFAARRTILSALHEGRSLDCPPSLLGQLQDAVASLDEEIEDFVKAVSPLSHLDASGGKSNRLHARKEKKEGEGSRGGLTHVKTLMQVSGIADERDLNELCIAESWTTSLREEEGEGGEAPKGELWMLKELEEEELEEKDPFSIMRIGGALLSKMSQTYRDKPEVKQFASKLLRANVRICQELEAATSRAGSTRRSGRGWVD